MSQLFFWERKIREEAVEKVSRLLYKVPRGSGVEMKYPPRQAGRQNTIWNLRLVHFN